MHKKPNRRTKNQNTVNIFGPPGDDKCEIARDAENVENVDDVNVEHVSSFNAALDEGTNIIGTIANEANGIVDKVVQATQASPWPARKDEPAVNNENHHQIGGADRTVRHLFNEDDDPQAKKKRRTQGICCWSFLCGGIITMLFVICACLFWINRSIPITDLQCLIWTCHVNYGEKYSWGFVRNEQGIFRG